MCEAEVAVIDSGDIFMLNEEFGLSIKSVFQYLE